MVGTGYHWKVLTFGVERCSGPSKNRASYAPWLFASQPSALSLSRTSKSRASMTGPASVSAAARLTYRGEAAMPCYLGHPAGCHGLVSTPVLVPHHDALVVLDA